MMELIQQAAILNVQGAEFLERKDFQQALISFNAALDCMSKAAGEYYWMKLIAEVAAATSTPPLLQLPADMVIATIDTAAPSPMEESPAADAVVDIPLMAVPKPCDEAQEPNPATAPFRANDRSASSPLPFAYSQALVFNPDVARNPLDRLFYSAILIYNCGLCFHQGGDSFDPSGHSKAASLYDICLDLLKESSTRFNCSHIIISAMNNKACVHIAERDYNQANGVLDQLLSVMLSTKGATSVFSDTDINGIMHNILLLKSSCIPAAA